MKLIMLILLQFCCIQISTSQDSQPASTTSELWKNPVIIGASVSDGYDHTEPFGGPKSEALSLEVHLSKLLKVPHGKISNIGNKFFFIRPIGVHSKQVEVAAKIKPSIVLSPDYLFWLVYGNFTEEKSRIDTLQSGLKKLETFDCPVVIGNIPDASDAVHKMLSRSQVPQLKTIRQANTLLQEWAKNRKNISIVDLDSFMKASVSNETIKLKHIQFHKGSTRKLLQSDSLHPTKEGVKAVCYAMLEALQKITDFSDQDVDWKQTD